MKKSISKKQIIDTVLDLMKEKNELRNLNLREIARTLGCAHTNIYNYFPSYTDLLWEAHTSLQEVFINLLRDNLSLVTTTQKRSYHFFNTFAKVYLDNKGWFRLAWLEYIGNNRPESNKIAMQNAHMELMRYAADIWTEIADNAPSPELLKGALHNTHCYIIGEISDFISGRGLINNESELKEYVVNQAVLIFSLYMRSDTN